MSPKRPSGFVDSAFEAVADAKDSALEYLATDSGRRLRRRVASVVILAAPFASRLPIIRSMPVARALRAAAVVTLVMKGAEWLRDWEPTSRPAGYAPETSR